MFATSESSPGGEASAFPAAVATAGDQGSAAGMLVAAHGDNPFPRIIGSNPRLRQVLNLAARVAPTPASVLITGETGTGKELVAQGLHALSPRRGGPFVCVNCGAIPLGIAEAELFGHERGAFTGAVESRPGRFEVAHGGTIFLDEIAELPPELQVKLLRVLQEREVQRVGSHRTRKIDVRIIAATNRNLDEELRTGRFREDLYYRIATVAVELPALRERSDDVPVLAAYLLGRACREFGMQALGFSAAAVEALCRHAWPGNVRELRNVVERALLLSEDEIIGVDHLPSVFAKAPRFEVNGSLGASMRFEKRQRVEAALRQTNGNRAAASRLLCMSRSNFNRLLRTLGVGAAALLRPPAAPRPVAAPARDVGLYAKTA